jgi:RNA polymerase sigma-70 factor (ECF subfamily)
MNADRKHRDVEHLLEQARSGDGDARGQVLERFRERLKSLAAARLDRRLARRIDPSDVAQEVLAEADRRLEGYLEVRPLPFYPWLVQLARDRLIDARRKHLEAGRRSVLREDRPLSGSGLGPAATDTAPVDRVIRAERRTTLHSALDRLTEADRRILLLRHVEGLSAEESAVALNLSEEAAKSRHRRALERLRTALKVGSEGERAIGI